MVDGGHNNPPILMEYCGIAKLTSERQNPRPLCRGFRFVEYLHIAPKRT
jgi:hypothetical protein